MMTIKEARLAKGLSQMKIAEELGVSLITYILWEKGVTKNPMPANKKKLDEILGLDEMLGLSTGATKIRRTK